MSEHYFVIYTQPGCKWCGKAKELIHEKGFGYVPIDLSKLGEDARQAFKAQFTPAERTLPKIMFGTQWIGGYEELDTFFHRPEAAQFLRPVVIPPILAQRLSATAGELSRGSAEAVGLDLRADLGVRADADAVTLRPGDIEKIPTGWALRAPPGHYLRVAPRSGLALKGLDPLAGVVDRDYTGQIFVVLANHGTMPVTIAHHDRIAQVIAERAAIPLVQEVEALPTTQRSGGGFGSTGA